MKKLYILLALFICFFSTIDEASAQRRGRDNYRGDISKFRGFRKRFPQQNKYLSLGITVNAMNYFGDLAPKSNIFSTDISLTRPGIGLMASYRVGPRISIRGNFTYGRVTGDDKESADPDDEDAVYRYVRNLNFRNDIKELAVMGMVDLFKHNRSYISRLEWTPYAFAGIAVIHHNPQGQVPDYYTGTEASPGEWVDLEPLGTEGQYAEGLDVDKYSNFQVAVPFGIGIRYKISQNFDFAFEIGYRHLFFDHLDDVGGDYVDKNRLGGPGSLAAVMSDKSQEYINEGVATITYESAVEGTAYQVIPGYGHENNSGVPNIRGNSSDDDIYVVTSFQLIYIFGPRSFKRAKFR